MDNLINNGGGLHNYSTQEHIVGKWIDGSDVYEKTYTASVTSGATTVDTEKKGLIISADGCLVSSDNRIFFICFMNSTAAKYLYCYYAADSGKLNITSNLVGTVYLTIRYTK